MKYSLQKTSPFEAFADNFKDTLSYSLGLVVYGGMTGFLCIVLNSSLCKWPVTMDHPVVIAAGTVAPLVCMYRGLSYAAKQVFKNFKKERARVNRLALALEKQEAEKSREPVLPTLEEMHRVQDMNLFNGDKKVVNLDDYRVSDKGKQKVLMMDKRA